MNSWTQRILERVRAHLGVEDLSTCPRDRLVGSIRHVAGETLKGSEVQAVVRAAREGCSEPAQGVAWDEEAAIPVLLGWLRQTPDLKIADAHARAVEELDYPRGPRGFAQAPWKRARALAEAEGIAVRKRGRPSVSPNR